MGGTQDAQNFSFGEAVINGQDARCPSMFGEVIIERLAVDVVHHEEWIAVVFLEGTERDDVGMRELHRHERLVLQLAVCALVGDEDARQHLDRERFVVELRILHKPHTAHAAMAELLDSAIPICEERSLGVPRNRLVVVDGVVDHRSVRRGWQYADGEHPRVPRRLRRVT